MFNPCSCITALFALGNKEVRDSPRGFAIAVITMIFFQQVASSGFLSSSMSTLQHTFGFSIAFGGIILSTNGTVKLFVTIPATHWLDQGDFPKIFSWMCFFMAISNLMIAAPGLAKALGDAVEDNAVCVPVPDGSVLSPEIFADPVHTYAKPICDGSAKEGSDNPVKWVFFLAEVVAGLGSAPLFALGPAYFNAHMTAADATYYCTIFYGAPVAAVAVGFVIGGIFLQMGAYYLGFILVALVLLTLVPVFRSLPATPVGSVRAANVAARDAGFAADRAADGAASSAAVAPEPEPESAPTGRLDSRRGSSLLTPEALAAVTAKQAKPIHSRIYSLVTKPAWIFSTLASVSENFCVSAYVSFCAQFFESYFSMPAFLTPLLAGVVIVPAAVLGTWAGGTYERRNHRNLADTAFWNVKICAVALCIIGSFALSATKCGNAEIVGVAAGFEFSSPACALDGGCACAQTYQPVCFNDEVTYFSPCHAGCTDWRLARADREEAGVNSTACGCWDGGESGGEGAPVVQPTDGVCPSQWCAAATLWLAVLFAFIGFTFANNTTVQMILMRSVPVEDSAFGLALHVIMWNLFGQPGTVIMGFLFDKQCRVFDAGTCARDGSCAIYDNDGLFTVFTVFYGVGSKAVTLAFFLLAWDHIRKSAAGKRPYVEEKKGGEGGG